MKGLAIYLWGILPLVHCITESDGQYTPDYSGQYVHDDSGRYIPDYSGLYRDDGTGRYTADRSGLGLVVKNTNILEEENQEQYLENENQQSENREYPRSIDNSKIYQNQNSPDGKWRIIKQNVDVDLDRYNWEYETENGILAAENGQIQNKGSQNEGMKSQGFYQYTGPDNVVYSVSYTADENGFVAQGNHLPTPPPIPKEIAKHLQNK